MRDFETMAETLTEWLKAREELADRREWEILNQAVVPLAGFLAKRLVLVTYEGAREVELPTTEVDNPDREPRFILRLSIHPSLDETERDHLLGRAFFILRTVLVEEAGLPPFGISGIQSHRSSEETKTDLGSGFMMISLVISDL